MSAPAPDFEVERFERFAVGRTVLLHVEGRWRARSHVRLSSPMLLLDDGRDGRRVAAVRGPEDVAPVAGPDPPLWHAGFAVPATLLTGGHVSFALETSRGVVALPPPDEPVAPTNERRKAMAALEERLAAVHAALAHADEMKRGAIARDEASAGALELTDAVGAERSRAVLAARAAANRVERTKTRTKALEHELDELRWRAGAGTRAERRALRARIAELETAHRALAELADRASPSEDALEAARRRGGEPEGRGERMRAELVALREANARALQEEATLDQSQADAQRLVARIAELERVAEQLQRPAADRPPELEGILQAARARRSEVEERAERTRAELLALAVENARKAEIVDRAQADVERRLAALEAELAEQTIARAAAGQRVEAATREVGSPAGLAHTTDAQRDSPVAEPEHRAAEVAQRAGIAALLSALAKARDRVKATSAQLLRGSPVLALVLGAVLVGIIAGIQPVLAGGLVGVALVMALAFFAPVMHLALLVAITAIVPYEWQQQVELGLGGAAMQVSDLLLISGLARAGLVLARRPPTGVSAAACALMLVFMTLVVAQGIHGWTAGYAASQVVYETRELLTWGTLLIAIPILTDPRHRQQLLRATMAIGLLVGLWGIAQWVLDIPFGEAGDAGVQAGVALTSTGRGQVQGALFAFPVALLISLAVLVSGRAEGTHARVLLVTIVVTNALSLLLTFERSLWVATVTGILFIVLRASAVNRFKAIITLALVVLLTLPVLATVAPGALTTAGERLLSIGQYGSDRSVRFRIDESRVVIDRIADHPLVGSGMGATIHWGRPYDRVLPGSTSFAHNSVLWLSWKVGVPGAILLLAVIACAFAVPRRRRQDATDIALRHGAQAALLAMMIVSVTFQSLASRPITPTLGLALALCVAGAGAGARAEARLRLAPAERAEPLGYAA